MVAVVVILIVVVVVFVLILITDQPALDLLDLGNNVSDRFDDVFDADSRSSASRGLRFGAFTGPRPSSWFAGGRPAGDRTRGRCIVLRRAELAFVAMLRTGRAFLAIDSDDDSAYVGEIAALGLAACRTAMFTGELVRIRVAEDLLCELDGGS